MKTTIGAVLAVTFFLLASGCHSKPSNQNAGINSKDSLISVNKNPSWADSAVWDYIQHSSSQVMVSVRNDTLHIRFMEDTETVNGVCYKKIQLGIDNDIRFETIAWLYLDTFKRKIYEYDLPNDSLILWNAGGMSVSEISIELGNIMLTNTAGFKQSLTNKGIDTLPVLSPNGKLIVFLRSIPGSNDTDNMCTATEAIWLYDINTQKEEQLVTPQFPGPPEKTLASFHNLTFSADSRYIYFNSCAWAVSGSIHRYDLDSHSEKFISDGNGFTIVDSGKYKGYLITDKHKYYNGGGSYDHNWLITPDGKEVKDIGEEETVQ